VTAPLPHPWIDARGLSDGVQSRVAALRQRAVHDSHNADVREVVRLRANDACEYCLLPTLGKFEMEHISFGSILVDLRGVEPLTF